MFKVSSFPKPLFYVYGLVCPIYKEIKYIGLTKNPDLRLYQHLNGRCESKRKNEWLIQLKELGLKPELIILNSYKDRAFASDEEERYINENRHTLLNGLYTMKYPSRPNENSYEIMNNINMTMRKDVLSKLNKISLELREKNENVIAQLILDKYDSLIVRKKRK